MPDNTMLQQSHHPNRQDTDNSISSSAAPYHPPHLPPHDSPNPQHGLASGLRSPQSTSILAPSEIRSALALSARFSSYANLIPYCTHLGIDATLQLKSLGSDTSGGAVGKVDGPRTPLDILPRPAKHLLGDDAGSSCSVGKDGRPVPFPGLPEPVVLGKRKQIHHHDLDGEAPSPDGLRTAGATSLVDRAVRAPDNNTRPAANVCNAVCALHDRCASIAPINNPYDHAKKACIRGNHPSGASALRQLPASHADAVQKQKKKKEKENQRMQDRRLRFSLNKNQTQVVPFLMDASRTRAMLGVGSEPQNGMKDKSGHRQMIPASTRQRSSLEQSLPRDRSHVGSSSLQPLQSSVDERTLYAALHWQQEGSQSNVYNYQHHVDTRNTTTTSDPKFKANLLSTKHEIKLCYRILYERKKTTEEEKERQTERILSALDKLHTKSRRHEMSLKLLAEVKLAPLIRDIKVVNGLGAFWIRRKAEKIYKLWEKRFKTRVTRSRRRIQRRA